VSNLESKIYNGFPSIEIIQVTWIKMLHVIKGQWDAIIGIFDTTTQKKRKFHRL
jgi:hypothetical protein